MLRRVCGYSRAFCGIWGVCRRRLLSDKSLKVVGGEESALGWEKGSPTKLSSLVSEYDEMQTSGEMSLISGYDSWGFKVNDVHMRGSVLVFPRFSLLWDVQTLEDISPSSLSPVHLLEPAIRLLLVGTGETMRNINPELYGYFSRRGVAIEPMTNAHAMSTFNLLVREGRDVAAALLSPEPLTRSEACLYLSGSPYTDPDAEDASRRLMGDGGQIFQLPSSSSTSSTSSHPTKTPGKEEEGKDEEGDLFDNTQIRTPALTPRRGYRGK